jgi:hypothetical protein
MVIQVLEEMSLSLNSNSWIQNELFWLSDNMHCRPPCFLSANIRSYCQHSMLQRFVRLYCKAPSVLKTYGSQADQAVQASSTVATVPSYQHIIYNLNLLK